MEKRLFLGDEAIAQAAIDAGLSGVYAYPGTPSTEITEYIQAFVASGEGRQIHCRWSTNEKTAMEAALGMSYAGKRALCCMKHVGLNVAADCFLNVAMSGIGGGLLIVTADDPSMHSSQNEQDNRLYGDFAMLPILEPSDQQEAYDMVYEGFNLSEKLGYPLLVRITTRMAHSRSGVLTRPPRPQNPLHTPEDGRQRFILLPALARQRFKALLRAQDDFTRIAEESPYNRYYEASSHSLGILTTGIAFNYLSENYPDGFPHPVLKITHYPLPVLLVERLAKDCPEVLVLEEGYPFVERQLTAFFSKTAIHGRLDGTLPRDGELTPDNVGRALGRPVVSHYPVPDMVVPRPPALCQGCGHRDMYEALNTVVAEYAGTAKVFSDIGCYTLGALPPFQAIDSCIDMGASITMAKGASDAGLYPVIAVIGDSTFTHSGMTGLLDCVNENSNVTVIISDNETTAMTGGQDSAGTGRLAAICAGLGVAPEHIRQVIPLKKNMEALKQLIREEIDYVGVSVIIPCRECIQTLARKKKKSGN